MTQEDEEYEIEDIVGVKKNKENFFFRVRWFGYKREDDTWEPEENLKHLTKFKKKMSSFKEELLLKIGKNPNNKKGYTPKIDRSSSSNYKGNNSRNNTKIKKRESVERPVIKKQSNATFEQNCKVEKANKGKQISKKRTRQNEERAPDYDPLYSSESNWFAKKRNNYLSSDRWKENIENLEISKPHEKKKVDNKKVINKTLFKSGNLNNSANNNKNNNNVETNNNNNTDNNNTDKNNTDKNKNNKNTDNNKKNKSSSTVTTNKKKSNNIRSNLSNNYNVVDERNGITVLDEDKTDMKIYLVENKRTKNIPHALGSVNSTVSEESNGGVMQPLSNYTTVQSTTSSATKKLLLVEDIYGVRYRNNEIQYMGCVINDKAMWLTEEEIEKTPHVMEKLKDYKNYILQDTADEEMKITIKSMHTIGNYLYLSVILYLGNGEQMQCLYPSKVVEYIYPHEYIKFLLSKLHFEH